MLNRAEKLIPTYADLMQFAKDQTIDAILVGRYSADEQMAHGLCYFDRKNRFEDAYPIFTSIVQSYDAVSRILTTKNSRYLLTKGGKNG